MQVIAFAEKKIQEQNRPTNMEQTTPDGFPYEMLTTWQSIHSTSDENPSLVLELMLDANLHTLARQWVDMFLAETKREEFKQLVDQSELCYLLRKDDIAYSEAHMVS